MLRSRILVTMADAQVELGRTAEATSLLDAALQPARPRCRWCRPPAACCWPGPAGCAEAPTAARRGIDALCRERPAERQSGAGAALAGPAAPRVRRDWSGAGGLRGGRAARPGRRHGCRGRGRHPQPRSGAVGVRRSAGRIARDGARRGGRPPRCGPASGRSIGPGCCWPPVCWLEAREFADRAERVFAANGPRWTWRTPCWCRRRSTSSLGGPRRRGRRPGGPRATTPWPGTSAACWRPG